MLITITNLIIISFITSGIIFLIMINTIHLFQKEEIYWSVIVNFFSKLISVSFIFLFSQKGNISNQPSLDTMEQKCPC